MQKDLMSSAQFAKSYIYQAKPPKSVVFDKDGNSQNKSFQEIFNQKTLLPKHIALKDNLGYMRLILQPAVLRFNNSKNKEGHERYYSEMLLFSHWKNEEKEFSLEEDNCMAEFIRMQIEIQSNRKVIYPGEEVAGLLEEKDLKEILKAFKPTHLLDTLDGQGNQESTDDLEEGIVDDPAFESFAYTDNLDSVVQEQF